MSRKFTAACVQIAASDDVDGNINKTEAYIRQACAAGATFVATPEYFSGLRVEGRKTIAVAYAWEGHPVVAHFAALAAELGIRLLLGSVGVTTGSDKILNRSVLLSENGDVLACYDKIHLFDVDLGQGRSYRESDTMQSGNTPVLADAGDFRLGMSICYDVRFAYLYRYLAQHGADVLAVPAAFTKRTGEAHWHVLNRARAIETGSFVIAPGQCGKVTNGGFQYGHSLIINPWGEVLCDGGEEEGVVCAEIDLSEVAACRRKIPAINLTAGFIAD
ncbi:carbon-nitrogen hydrolase family protein [Granulosicoccaceae sp. 1_MG-2023]|nr:carbon-nitrogen hydrolase family protein [Granulosicoccaceae sp. 1_MG-2023]